MNSKPLVSVIMPFYNAETHISEATRSILKQSFTDFEFIMLNDASIDSSFNLVKKFNDSRIMVINHNINKGLVESLNELLRASRGKYIARMDADDISLPDRFEKQVDYLEKNSEVGILGSIYARINSNGNIEAVEPVPISDNDIKIGLTVKNCFAHGSVMLRKSLIDSLIIPYNDKYQFAEDYDLWLRLSKSTKMKNLPEVLYFWRKHDQSLSKNNDKHQSESVKIIGQNQNELIKRLKITDIINFSRSAFSQPDDIFINEKPFQTNLKREYQFILKELSVRLLKENLIKSFVAALFAFLISPPNIFRKFYHA